MNKRAPIIAQVLSSQAVVLGLVFVGYELSTGKLVADPNGIPIVDLPSGTSSSDVSRGG